MALALDDGYCDRRRVAAESESRWREREARDDMLAEEVRNLAPQVIGLSTAAADEIVTTAGLSIRYHRASDFVTEEFVSGRMTACIEGDVIVTVAPG